MAVNFKEVDRIHKVLEFRSKHGTHERRMGFTTLCCHEVVGRLFLSNPGDIFYVVINHMKEKHDFMKVFYDVWQHHFNISFRYIEDFRDHFIFEKMVRVYFVTPDDAYRRTAGIDTIPVFDLYGSPAELYNNPMYWKTYLRTPKEDIIHTNRKYYEY
jgi:hypothetical protein